MSNLIKAEWFKLRKDRAFLTLVGLMLIAAVAYPLMLFMDSSPSEPMYSSQTFLQNALAGNAYVIKFSAALLAGFFISSEYSTGVMKSIASSGNSRVRIFTAKLVIFSVGSMILALVFPVVGTFVVSIINGFDDWAIHFVQILLRSMGLTILYAAGFASIAALFSTILTDSGKAIGFSLIFMWVIDSIIGLIGVYIPLANTLYDYSVFKLVNDISIPDRNGAQLTALVAVPLVWFLIFGVLGVFAYRKKEIK